MTPEEKTPEPAPKPLTPEEEVQRLKEQMKKQEARIKYLEADVEAASNALHSEMRRYVAACETIDKLTNDLSGAWWILGPLLRDAPNRL